MTTERAQRPAVERRLSLTAVRSSHVLISVLLVLITVAAFWQTLGNDFIRVYDDNEYVTENPPVYGGLTKANIIWAFTKWHSANWHPLTWISHMLDCRLYKLNPMGHHLTNLLFHIANVLLLYWVLVLMTKYKWRSALVAALFAVHPLHVESVAWIAERKDVLSTFFWLLTMLAYVSYVRDRSIGKYMLVAALLALGLMSKPMLVTLPFALLLMDYWPLGRFESKSKQAAWPGWKLVWEKIPLFVLAAASSVVTLVVQHTGKAVGSLQNYPLGDRIANALVAYVLYIVKMFWPRGLAVFYPHPRNALPIWQAIVAFAALVCVTALLIRAAQRRPYLAAGWLWYLGTLVPVIGIVQVGEQALADRYTYVPFIGLFVLIAWGVPDLFRRGAEPREAEHGKLLAGLSLIVIAILTTCTWFQVRYWKNGVALFKHALACTSENHIAHSALGYAYMQQDKLDKAFFHYTESLRIDPNYEKAHNNLGLVLARQGKSVEAIEHYNQAIRINPKDSDPYNNLGNALSDMGKLDEAIVQYNEALRVNPDDAKAHYNMGNVLILQDKLDEALAQYEEAVRIKPDYAEAHNNLGRVLAQHGKVNEAIAHFSEALRIDPRFAKAHYNLGVALMGQGKLGEAISRYREAIKLQPDYGLAHLNLAVCLFWDKKYDEAWREVRLCRKYGCGVDPAFLKALSDKMPEPAE